MGEMAEAAASAVLRAHGGKSVASMGWGGWSRAPPLWVSRGAGVAETSAE